MGREEDQLPKQTMVCQLAGVGMVGIGCPYEAVLTAVCGTELTLLVVHLHTLIV